MYISEQMDLLDTLRSSETPEGISLELRVAGPIIRILAWLLDSLIKYAFLLLFMLGLAYFGRTGWGLWLIAFFVLEWFYPVWFEVYWAGATPGKRIVGLKVVTDSGAPVDFGTSLIRNLLRAADFLPVMYGFGLISMLFSTDSKRLGDLAAGTVVIYDNQQLNQPATLQPGPAQQPSQVLSLDEQRLLLNFAERSPRLNPERQAELANVLNPLTQSSNEQAIAQLLAYARWLAGGGLGQTSNGNKA